jgi:hypothetical protein
MAKKLEFIKSQIPNFDEQPEGYRNEILARVDQYFRSKEYSAETFEKYALRGTPSAIVVDRKGILRDVSFGQTGHLEPLVKHLLNE